MLDIPATTAHSNSNPIIRNNFTRIKLKLILYTMYTYTNNIPYNR